jgi:hypothetical protein
MNTSYEFQFIEFLRSCLINTKMDQEKEMPTIKKMEAPVGLNLE